MTAGNLGIARSAALKFIVLFGVVSLFADMTYEGARSITGPYLAVLGASGTVVVITRVESSGLPRLFWVYLAAASLIAAGYADFPLAAFHFEKESVVSANWIPVFYAIAMGVDGVSALAFGRLFDRIGISSLAIAALVSAFFAPLVFLGDFGVALLGAAVWGIGMGAQESIMRAAVAEMVTPERRGSAYGVFNAGYGVSWFLGSVLLGVLYDVSLPALIAFSMVAQLAAVPVLLRVRKPALAG